MEYLVDVDRFAPALFNEFCEKTVEARGILTVGLIRRCIVDRCVEVDGSYVISDKGLDAVWGDVSDILIGSVLSQLAAEGKIEVSWDDESQEFMFQKVSED